MQFVFFNDRGSVDVHLFLTHAEKYHTVTLLQAEDYNRVDNCQNSRISVDLSLPLDYPLNYTVSFFFLYQLLQIFKFHMSSSIQLIRLQICLIFSFPAYSKHPHSRHMLMRSNHIQLHHLRSAHLKIEGFWHSLEACRLVPLVQVSAVSQKTLADQLRQISDQILSTPVEFLGNWLQCIGLLIHSYLCQGQTD